MAWSYADFIALKARVKALETFLTSPVAFPGDVSIAGTLAVLNATISGQLIIPQSTAPANTAEGSLAWDTNDNIPVWGDGANSRRGSPWEQIGSIIIPSNTASITWTGLSGFRRLRLEFFTTPATDSVSHSLRVSTDNGATYDSAANYTNEWMYTVAAAAPAASQALANRWDQAVSVIGNVTGANQEGMAGFYDIYEFNQTFSCYASGLNWELNATPSNVLCAWGGRYVSSTARNALEFKMTSGNIGNGWVNLFGIRG